MAHQMAFSCFEFPLDNNLTSKRKLLVYLDCQVNETGNFTLNNRCDTEFKDT